MNLTFDQLVDIFEATGLAFRDGHAHSTGGCDVPGGICIGIPMDIDITDRLRKACDAINAHFTTNPEGT